jgi:hypothetical protein
MPRFDGTGPQGRGPMTGNGRGYCLMSMPEAPGEAATGFAGLEGRPVMIGNDPRKLMDSASLHGRLREIQAALHELKIRLANLEAAGSDRSAPPTAENGPDRPGRPKGHSA